MRRLIGVAGLLVGLWPGLVLAQVQSKEQQGCINALNKDAIKVAQA